MVIAFSPPTRRRFLQHAGTAVLGVGSVRLQPDESVLGLWIEPQETSTDLWREADAILRRIVPPTFPNRTFDIARYGARPTDTSHSTAAFRDAIDACHRAGGGRVIVNINGEKRNERISR